MALKIAINGFGRIGRIAFRKSFGVNEYEIVAINDQTSPKMIAHLLQYDSIHGKYELADTISVDDDILTVNGKTVRIFKESDVGRCPWKDLGIDLVLECSGICVDTEKVQAHMRAGAKKVMVL